MRVEWTTFALNIVLEQSEYIAETRSPASVEAWIDALFERTAQIEKFPESGRVVPELNIKNIREIRYDQYRIIYRITSEVLYILTIRHTRQLLTEDDIEK